MRTTNTFGIQFIVRKNKAKDGLPPIYARITVDGRRVEISLKRWINQDDWNNSKGMARGSREEIKLRNHSTATSNVMGEILLSRYELFVFRGTLTHLTSSLSVSKIESFYSNRVRSRSGRCLNSSPFQKMLKTNENDQQIPIALFHDCYIFE